MKFTPLIMGAVALTAIAGAASGAAIGQSPMLKELASETALPQTAAAAQATASREAPRQLPNHYPLETPQGTVEVAELALHGRMRDRGGDLWWERRKSEPTAFDAEYDFYATASEERIARERRLAAFAGEAAPRSAPRDVRQVEAPPPPPQPDRVSRAEAPLALSEPVQMRPAASPATDRVIGNAKVIDVQAELARRD